jgi:hypothetical protein
MGMPHADEQLAELRSMLLGLAIEHEGLDLYELDRFVAGLQVCSAMIMPRVAARRVARRARAKRLVRSHVGKSMAGNAPEGATNAVRCAISGQGQRADLNVGLVGRRTLG